MSHQLSVAAVSNSIPAGDDATNSESGGAGSESKSGVGRLPGGERASWHYIYFVLAALDIAAITAMFCFSWTTISNLTDDAIVNHQWDQRQGHYAQLSNLVGTISEHGGSVFSSSNAEREQAEFQKVLEQFRKDLAAARTDARVQMSGDQAVTVSTRLDQMDQYVDEADASAARMFEQIRQGRREQAVDHLVQVNRACTLITAQITELHRFIRTEQSARYDGQMSHAETMRDRQIWLGMCGLVMVTLVAWYGHKLTRAVHDSMESAREQADALADEQARLQTVFDAAAEGIITINDQGVIESCNRATLDLFHCEEADVIGVLLGSLMDDVDEGASHDQRGLRILDINALIGSKRELMAFRPDGTAFYVDLAVAEVRFADHRIITGILHDVTQRKEFEAELREARTAAESSTEAKSQFLANMSHEIRTPMTAILGYSDLLLEPQQSSEERMRCVETIRRNADHLLTLINDILDLSKIEAGKMTFEAIECSPCQIVSDVASLMRVRAIEKEVEFEVKYDGPVPKTVTSDPVRIRQLLINLVGNSIKFTKDGAVRIHVRTEDADGETPMLHFKVVDTGIGMTPEQLNRLFRPFTQADYSTTRQFGGTGLGLTICKRLVEMLGGGINVTSVPGLGSSFEFHVPTGSLADISMIESPTETTFPDSLTAAQAGGQTKVTARILLAEDGADNRRLISHHLRRAGATVETAENGKIAHDMALEAAGNGHPFDLIFMDMQMPVMDGYQATSTLREQGYTGPIVALTAHAMSGDRDKCISAGCSDYTTKPIEPRKLTEMICRYVPQRDQPADTATPVATVSAIELVAVVERDAVAVTEPVAIVEPVAVVDPGPARPEDVCVSATPTREPLVSEFADDPDMLEIVILFIDGLEEHIESLTDALARSDSETIYQTAHKLKGSAGGYGYPTLGDQSLQVEQLAKSDASIDELQPHVEQLIHLCHRVMSSRPTLPGEDQHAQKPIESDQNAPVEPVAEAQTLADSCDMESVCVGDFELPDVESRMDRLLKQIECLTESEPDWKELTGTLESLAHVVRDSLQNSRECEAGAS